MSPQVQPSMRALLIGVENYLQFEKGSRPGTVSALREINHRLQEGGWHTRLLVDEASTSTQRSGLTQILEGIEWLHGAELTLVIISGKIYKERFYPSDAKNSFIQQSTLSLADLIKALPAQSGVIIDGPVAAQQVAQTQWALIAQEREEEPESLFSSYGPTQFLHSITVALNTWPTSSMLKVREFFEFVKQQDPPKSLYNNYSSLQSMTLLTPIDQESNAVTLITAPPSGNTSIQKALKADTKSNLFGNEDQSESEEAIPSQSSHPRRAGRFVAKGRFQLLRVLGEGGIGQVYLAKDTQLGKQRAVKLLKIPEQLSEEQRTHIRGRMIQSAKAAQELSEFSHHVVQVYDIGIDEETEMPFMVMEYLKGITLNERLYRSPVLNLEQIFTVGLTLCETLAIAHQQNVIHRDLKPDNIMLIKRGGSDLFVKLLDFDLVKVESGDVKTQEGQILGTLEYMSPEQLKGQDIDARADVFALGAILYECFSGVRANPGKNQRELVRVLLSDGVKPLKEQAPHLPQDLCNLIDACLSLDPEYRPQDAAELVRRLKPLSHHQAALSMMSFSLITDHSSESSTPNTLTDVEAHGAVESLPITEDTKTEMNQDQVGLITRPLVNQDQPHSELTQASIHNTSKTNQVNRTPELSSANASQRMIAVVVGLVILLGLGFMYLSQGPASQNGISTQQNPPNSDGSGESSNQAGTNNKPTLKALESLMTLPIPSESWPAQVTANGEEIEGFGASRTYSGGRFAERLSRLVYELNFRWREGDPPIEAWSQSAEIRYQLLSRVNLNVLKESSGALHIPQNLYIELLSRRPEQVEQAKLGKFLKLPKGLLALKPTTKPCKQVMPGDLITDMRWVIRGRKSLNGSCQGTDCLNAYERSLKRKRYAKLKLTFNVERAVKKDGLWQTEKVKMKCAL